jgi:hypothetical protein
VLDSPERSRGAIPRSSSWQTHAPKALFRSSSSSPSSSFSPRWSTMHLGTRHIVLTSLCLFVKLGCIALLLSLQPSSSSRHSTTQNFPHPRFSPRRSLIQASSDYPRTWDIGILSLVRMNIEPTKHYRLLQARRRRRMGRPRPERRHLPPQVLPPSLLHPRFSTSLHCLDITRRRRWHHHRRLALVRVAGPALPELHAADGALSNWTSRSTPCWEGVPMRRVYEELEKNQQESARWAAAAER